MSEQPMDARRIGVYVCHCGGNISDYVDVEQVAAAAARQGDVVLAKTAMFACSDATQQEMVADIGAERLDGLVVASCSPKLHTVTFRGVATRANLNPYEYSQVNIREQCSWTHTDDPAGATRKAMQLVNAGIARTRLSTPLEPLVVKTTPRTLVIGGGITGLRTALGLADVGLSVFLVEREAELGGWIGRFGAIYPHERDGRQLIATLVDEIRKRPTITVFTGAELVSKSGSFGNYRAGIRVTGEPDGSAAMIELEVGSIVVATGFETYEPEAGEFGYGIDGVVTLPEFKALVDGANGPLVHHGRPVRDIAYVYCVGSRQDGAPDGNAYCSRYCCTAAVHASLQVAGLHKRATETNGSDAPVHQYHLVRDVRTYGDYELLYEASRKRGSVFVKFAEDAPPAVAVDYAGRLSVTVRDLLTGGEAITIPADLVVLVTGMVPRPNEELIAALKLPKSRDGFFNEIHPKLRPVETVVDGVLIAGACQAPRNSSESVGSGLAAVAQSAAILKKGVAELDPLVATVDADACTWCAKCLEACPFGAVDKLAVEGRDVAVISEAGCKGCGGCAPICPTNAIDLRGYTDAQVTAMIDRLAEVPA